MAFGCEARGRWRLSCEDWARGRLVVKSGIGKYLGSGSLFGPFFVEKWWKLRYCPFVAKRKWKIFFLFLAFRKLWRVHFAVGTQTGFEFFTLSGDQDHQLFICTITQLALKNIILYAQSYDQILHQ